MTENLKKFLEDNPKYTTEPTKKVPDDKHDPSRSAEMDGEEKDSVSHRGKAIKLLAGETSFFTD